jgi:hypothetical protein
VRHASISNGLLRMDTSRDRVSESGLKTDGDATVGGACGTITGITSSPS